MKIIIYNKYFILIIIKQNYQRHLTSKSYDHEDFGRLGTDEDGMSLEQMRDAPEAEVTSFEQSLLNKRTGRKRKAPQDDEVSHYKNHNKRGKDRFFSLKIKKWQKFIRIL